MLTFPVGRLVLTPPRALLAALALLLLVSSLPAHVPLVAPQALPIAPSLPTNAASPPTNAVQPAAAPAPHTPDFGKLPLSFVPNAGQTDPSVRFQVAGLGGAIFFTPQEVVLSLPSAADQDQRREQQIGEGLDPRSHIRDRLPLGESNTQQSVVRLRFVGANPTPTVQGAERLPGIVNYFLGNDPARWRTNVPTYAGIVYSQLYDGIALRYDGHEGTLKGTYTVAAGADPRAIRWRYEGATAVRVDAATGDLRVELPGAAGGRTLTERAPSAWQERGGRRVAVQARYELVGDGSIGFALGAYDAAQPLIIDPALVYSTYLGGSSGDNGNSIAVDGAGNAYITGDSSSTNFPTASLLQPNFGGIQDAFVVKLNSSGSALVYSTYLGGSNRDFGNSIAVDSAGNAYITGQTLSTNFPTTGLLQPNLRGIGDAFVVKLNSNGSALVYSTYLGGNGNNAGTSIAVDSTGNAYITGFTTSTNFPTTGLLQPTSGGLIDAFVVKLNSNGSALVYSTYLGGNDQDYGSGIAVDSAGNAYITGQTLSTNFPTTPPLQPNLRGISDAFVVKLNPNGSARLYSTYLGGSDSDTGNSIAVDGASNAYITGATTSTNFPTTPPLPSTLRGSQDAFVVKLNTNGAYVYSTYLGGSTVEVGQDIAVDGTGNAHITGFTSSADFPTANPLQPTSGGSGDAFVVKLNVNGSALYSTYLGGNNQDYGLGIAVDGASNAYITGYTSSTNFPTTSPLQPTLQGSQDAFLVKICSGNANDCISGLSAANDSPTLIGNPTTLTATIAAGTNVIYRWNFGDGTSATGQTTTHTYAAPGTYSATVTASNAFGSAAATTTVRVLPLLEMTYGVSQPSIQAGSTTQLNFTMTITATGAAVTAVLSATIPRDLTFAPGSLTAGASYDTATRRINFTGSVAPSAPRRITYRATPSPSVPAGTLIHSTADLTGTGYLLQRSATVAVEDPTFTGTLVLLYIGGDNNLSGDMLDLINDAERAADNSPNSPIKIMAALDGDNQDDSFVYELQPDHSGAAGVDNPLCPSYTEHICGRYVEDRTVYKWDEDMGSPSALAGFLTSAIGKNKNASRVVVALVGHGGGWSPDVKDGQPSWHDPQPDGLGGLLRDNHPGSALSTADLGSALAQASQARGSKLDLLYLDACNMATAEVAYEVSGSVQYLLASENTKWASFRYEEHLYEKHLNSIHGGMDGRAIGEAWLADEIAVLEEVDSDPFPYPYTYSLTDLTKMSAVVSATDSLAQALANSLPSKANHDAIDAALKRSECFDSNQDFVIALGDAPAVTGTWPPDNACDLASFARALSTATLTTTAVAPAAQQVQASIAAAVVAEAHHEGTPWKQPIQHWNWNTLGGLSIYVPLKVNESRRSLYGTLRFGRTRWAAFLAAWWIGSPLQSLPPCTTCADGPAPLTPPSFKPRAVPAAGGMRLTWNRQANGASYAASYSVSRWPIGGTAKILTPAGVTGLSFYDQDSTLRRETTYCYQVKAYMNPNASGTPFVTSTASCVRLEYIELWVGPEIAVVGQRAIVGINIRNALGLAIGNGSQIVLRFDPAVLAPTGSVTSLLPPGGTQVTYNYDPNNTPDRVTLGIQSSTTLAGDMMLVGVEFTVRGPADARSALRLDGTTLSAFGTPTPLTLRLIPGSLTVVAN